MSAEAHAARADAHTAAPPILLRPVGDVARATWSRVKPTLFLHEQHLWYVRDLDELPELALPAGYELRCASTDDLSAAAEAGRDPALVERYIEAGHELWMLVHGGQAAFSTWIFRGSAPAIAARDGWFALPANVACLEDWVTHPDFRGRGLAPVAVLGAFRALRCSGVERVVAKIESANASAHRAAAKAGFREVAKMRFSRIGPRDRARLADVDGEVGAELARVLER